MSLNKYTNKIDRLQQTDQDRAIMDTTTYERFETGKRRGFPAGEGRRGSQEPPGLQTTLEMPSTTINMFVRRGLDHDTAAPRPPPPSRVDFDCRSSRRR